MRLTSPARPDRPRGDRGESGQIIVLFALCGIALIAMAGLLIDGGFAWSNRRAAQSAADTAALAAAKAVVAGKSAAAAATTIATANGFPPAITDCAGNSLANGGLTINRPPASGPHSGDDNFVEVIATRPMRTTFAGAVGQPCWMVSGRAVASIASAGVATCSFCSLNSSNKSHTLMLKNGATLRVDGDIYTNSSHTWTKTSDWIVAGDGFDIFGTGSYISAQTISVVGGWETHDQGIVTADSLALKNGVACPNHPNPVGFGSTQSNVCIYMPVIADPLNDPLNPGNIINPPVIGTAPVAGANGCPAGALTPSAGRLIITTSVTICPGTYPGGISIQSGGNVTMTAGVYYIAGGGFEVIGSGAVNGAAGVMIYNASGSAGAADTNPGVDLVPPKDSKKTDLKKSSLSVSPGTSVDVGEVVKLTLNVESKSSPTPTGTITFFDGKDKIPGCIDLPVVKSSSTTGSATCTTSWSTSGTKGVSGVYYGDDRYNAAGDAKTITVAVPAGGPVTITTSGNVVLSGPTSGPYSGLTIFQERSSAAAVTLSPGAGSATACGAGYMTIGVPNGTAPAACGPLGGLQGTIYAPNQDAQVHITAGGLTNLQVISGLILVDSSTVNARFAFTPGKFANGNVRLVE